jgi:hypothetical protein
MGFDKVFTYVFHGTCIRHGTFASHLLMKHGHEEHSFDFGNGMRWTVRFFDRDQSSTEPFYQVPAVSTTGFDRVLLPGCLSRHEPHEPFVKKQLMEYDHEEYSFAFETDIIGTQQHRFLLLLPDLLSIGF